MFAWACSAMAEAAPPSVSLRVAAAAGGGVDLEWTRDAGPPGWPGWHVERQQPGGGVLRVTDERVDAGLFASPSFVYRFRDASASARAGDVVSYRLVTVDPELREWPAPFESYVVEAAPENVPPSRAISRMSPAPISSSRNPVSSMSIAPDAVIVRIRPVSNPCATSASAIDFSVVAVA